MFYSQFILAKKGPLGTIWIAAHLERKLRKNQVTETNISVSVDSILFPEVPIALRLSGHLLLGVVRIYSRKVNYLFHDCSEALVKIKQAFHAGAVDLPPEAATAPFHSITLPETFDLDEFEPLLDKELNLLHANGAVDHHITSREQITLQDPMEDSNYLGSSQFELDERFPDGDAPQLEIDFDEDLLDKAGGAGSHAASPLNEEEDMPLEEDVLPPSRMDEELDYAQMDRMEVMDIDDHPEPVTPGLGLDNMDLDYQRDPEDEELDAGQDMERLEPTFALDNEDLGPADLGAERLAPEATTPGSPENEALEDQRKSGLDLDLEASDDPHGLEEEEGAVHRVEETVATPGEEEARSADEGQAVEQAVERELEENFEQMEEERDDVVERTAEEGVAVDVLPDEKTLDEEGETRLEETAGAQNEGLFRMREDEEGPDEVPEYEKVMSAPEETNQDRDVFDLEAGLDMEPASETLPYETEQQAEEGASYMEEEGGQPAGMTDPMSPMRSPPVPVISSEDLPGDDDLLASLPGRRISGLTLVPTPSDNAATKTRRRQQQRKRKIVIDMGTILGADVMKQQLENTDDIRRVRRKAPCTRQELWSVHKESLNQQLFCEHSVPGLCGELRILFERVYVLGEANLPQAEPMEPEIVPGEELLEPQQQEQAQEQAQDQAQEQAHELEQEQEQEQHPVMEDLNADLNAEMHPDDMKEVENEIPGSPIIQEEAVPAEAPIDQQQVEVAGAAPPSPLETLERVLSPVDTLPSKFEEAENIQIQTPVSRHEDQATLGSPKEELPNVLDTEVVHPVDLNSASLEMEEAMETLREQEALETDVQEAAEGPTSSTTVEEMQFLGRLETPDAAATVRDFHPMIDVNVTNPEDEADAFEGNPPEAMNAPDLGVYGTPAHGPPATADVGTEFPSSNVPFSEAETEPYVQDTVVEETQRIGSQGEFDSVEGMHGVGPSSEFDTQILPTVEHFRQDPQEGAAGVPMGQEDAFTASYREDKAEPYDVERQPAAFETTPAQARPEEDLEFLADARDTEFLGADDDDLVEEPEDFQELNDYSARKEAVSQDNSGWSARTRAVGHFLRITLEDKDAYMQRRGEQGVAKLGLERVLVGKSRKEAARMFFETLVLKTKDYIHVDQDQPYGDIQISSRPKLMKAKF